MKLLFIGIIGYCLIPQGVSAQEQDIVNDQAQTVLDPSPFISARAASLGNALSTLADGIHAPFYNPAGIGGIHWDRNKPPFVRQLNLPYMGIAVNENSTQLSQEFSTQDASNDRMLGKALVDANAGKRQYARSSFLFSFGMGRLLFLHGNDLQVAAIKNQAGELDGPIQASYRSQSITGIGGSITDPSESIYMGFFTSYLSRSLFEGEVTFDDLATQTDRENAILSQRETFNGLTTNVGTIWVFSRYLRPTLAVAVRNIGGANLKINRSQEDSPDILKLEEDLTVGFSVTPQLGKNSYFSFIMEGTNLSSKEIAVNKKFRTGMELNFDGFGSQALVGARVGYNLAGVSYGMSLNFNLIQLEVASHAEDIGVDNSHLVERRNVAIFSVNVTDD